MRVQLANLKLDKENPRFIVAKNSDTIEEDIFSYLRETESLEVLISSIARTGFFKIGERPIVVKDANNPNDYIVLEGNRRVCALKALHGFYSKKYDFSDELKNDSKEIEVDVANSREEVQPFLAARHIQGIKLWEPEARRNFYYKHYKNGKSLKTIENITQQRPQEIKKFIKELLFLDFFKNRSGYATITTPSLIYERIQRYFIELEFIKEFDVPEEYNSCNIEMNTELLSEEEFNEFCKLLADSIFSSNSFINSRNINKIDDFKTLLKSQLTETRQPRLKFLFIKAMNSLEKKRFVPSQIITEAIKDRVPPVNKIIDYSLLSSAVLKIYLGNKSITEQEFINGNQGDYLIKINDYSFAFRILEYRKPSIHVIEEPFKHFKINTTEDISRLINVYDVYGDKVDLNNSNITFTTSSNKLEITHNKNIYIKEGGLYSVDIKYSFNGNLDYTVSKTILVKGCALKGLSTFSQYSGYFDFKYLDVNSIVSSIVTGQLISELEDNYSRKNLNIFAAALRCVSELSLDDLLYETRQPYAGKRWKSAKNGYQIISIIKDLKFKDFKEIAKKFYSKRNVAKKGTEMALSNYLGTNITNTATGHTLDPVINTLHLGVHGTLKYVSATNLENIKATFMAFLELIYILIEINCSI